jgi:hypothetical protein
MRSGLAYVIATLIEHDSFWANVVFLRNLHIHVTLLYYTCFFLCMFMLDSCKYKLRNRTLNSIT